MRSSLRGEEILHVGSLHATIMDSSIRVLCFSFADVPLRLSGVKALGTTGRRVGAFRGGFDVYDTTSLQLCISIPFTEVLAEPT